MKPTHPHVLADSWGELRALTGARIALGRAGGSLPTTELLAFEAAHAAARDAVWSTLDAQALESEARALLSPVVRVRSQALDRPTYLQRPDLGRRLDPTSLSMLSSLRQQDGCDLVVIVADGLAASAANRHAMDVVSRLVGRLLDRGLQLGPLVLAEQARVALEDPVGLALGARAALILLGERPGLSSPHSLGAYLVFGPRPGRCDAERNCVSNIRPDGLPFEAAVELIEWLVVQALGRQLSGVSLKDERGLLPHEAAVVAARGTATTER